MLSVGQPRRFMVANVPQNIWETYTLAHGSLLTFFWKIRHSMPAEKHPCAARISVIFRYVPKGLVEIGVERAPAKTNGPGGIRSRPTILAHRRTAAVQGCVEVNPRILIVDDHHAARTTLRELLDGTPSKFAVTPRMAKKPSKKLLS